MLVLHYTGMASAEDACRWLCDPRSKVSSHYLVDEAGEVTQLVDETMRAWHAGAASWAGDSDVNSRSIGIEIHNPGPEGGYPDFPEAQMEAVVELCREIVARHSIAPERVLAHSDVAPGRKIDPGEKFDWRRLAKAGVGLWVEQSAAAGPDLAPGNRGEEVRSLQQNLTRFGYGLEAGGVYDEATRTVVAALQRHFRPARVDGIADRETQGLLAALLAATNNEG
jgi:N-acetylmuramoyl-L-alanine amidase